MERYDLASEDPPRWLRVDVDQLIVRSAGVELQSDGALASGKLPFVWPDTPPGLYRIASVVAEFPPRTEREGARHLQGTTATIVIG